MTEVYADDDYPHGLRCMDCNAPFQEGQQISERLLSVGDVDSEPCATVDLICVPCALGGH